MQQSKDKSPPTSVFFFGPCAAGKSYFLKRYSNNSPADTRTQPTIGIDYFYKQYNVGNLGKKQCKLWDTNGLGTSQYINLYKSFIGQSKTNLFVIFYDLTCQSDFKTVQNFVELTGQTDKNAKMRVLIVGNKVDLISPQESKIRKLIKEKYGHCHNFEFAEVSCRQNIDHAIGIIEKFIKQVNQDQFKWISDIQVSINKAQIKDSQIDEQQIWNKFNNRMKNKKNVQEVIIIKRLIDSFREMQQHKRHKNHLQQKYQTAIKLLNQQRTRTIDFKNKIKVINEQHQQQLLTLQYWLIEATTLLQSFQNVKKDEMFKQKLQRINEFASSIDQYAKGDEVEVETNGNSIISSSVLLQNEDRALRRAKRINLQDKIQKYQQILSDVLPSFKLIT